MKAVKLNDLLECNQYRSSGDLWFYPIVLFFALAVLIAEASWISAHGLTLPALGVVAVWCFIVFRNRQKLLEFWRRNVIGYKLLVIMTHDEVGLDPLSEKFHQVEEVDYVVSLTTEIPDGILGYQVGGFGGPFIGLCLSLRSVFGKYPWTLMKMFRPWVHDGVPTSIRFSNHSLKCVDVRNTRGEQLHFLDFKTAYQLAVDGFRMARWKISRCNAYQLGFNKYHNAHFALTQAIVAAVKTIASSSRFCKSKEAKEVRQDLHEALKENLAEDHLLAIVDALQETEGAKVG